MKLPNKVVSYKISTIPKFIIILEELKSRDLRPHELYYIVKKKVNDIKEYIEIIEALYVLDKIELTSEGELHYVKND